MRASALQRLKGQAFKMKRKYDNKVRAVNQPFEVGDVVKLRNPKRSRMSFKWMGPYYFSEKIRRISKKGQMEIHVCFEEWLPLLILTILLYSKKISGILLQ